MACPPNDSDWRSGGWTPPGDLSVCASLLTRPDCVHDFWHEYGTSALHMCKQYAVECSHDGDFSLERYAWKRWLIIAAYGVVLHLVCLCGFVGNALTVLVLRRRELSRSTSTVYLTAMLIVDTLYLAVSYAHWVVVVALGASPWHVSPLPAYSRVVGVYVLSDFARSVGALLTVAVTADRYVHVRHSASASKVCTRPRAVALTLLIVLVVAAYEVPRALVLRVVASEPKPAAAAAAAEEEWAPSLLQRQQNSSWSGGSGASVHPPNGGVGWYETTSASASPSPFDVIASSSDPLQEPCRFKEPIYGIVNDHALVSHDADTALMYVGQALLMFVPLLVLIILTALLLRAIGRWSANRRRLSSRSSQKAADASLNAVLISVVITFILCTTPMAVIGVLREVADLESFISDTTAGALLHYAAVTALNVNAALNAALFCAFGSKFRKEFAVMLRCRQASDGESSKSGYATLSVHVTLSAMPSSATSHSPLTSCAPTTSATAAPTNSAPAAPAASGRGSNPNGEQGNDNQPTEDARPLLWPADTERADSGGTAAVDLSSGARSPESTPHLPALEESGPAETRDL